MLIQVRQCASYAGFVLTNCTALLPDDANVVGLSHVSHVCCLDIFRANFHNAQCSESDEMMRVMSPVLSSCARKLQVLQSSAPFETLLEVRTRGNVYNMCCYIVADDDCASWHICSKHIRCTGDCNG